MHHSSGIAIGSDKMAELQSGRGRAAVGHHRQKDREFSQVRWLAPNISPVLYRYRVRVRPVAVGC